MYKIVLIFKCFIFLLEEWNYDLNWLPYFSTPYTNYKNIEEAKFLIENQYNPYNTDGIFQKPLLVYGLIQINSKFVFLITDLIIGYLIATLFGQKIGYKKSILLFYHINPITFLSLIMKNTNIFDHLFLLLTIWTTQNMLILCPILFGILIYLNPQYFIVIATLAVIIRRKNDSIIKFSIKIILILLVSFGIFFILIHFSYLLTGDWKFLDKTYIDFYFVKDHKPTIGFLWALFSGLFTKYKQLYHAFFMIIPLCYIIPLYNLFIKYSKKESQIYGFMLGISLFSSILYFQYVTVTDLVFIFMLMFQRYEWLFNSLPTIVICHAGLLILFLGGFLQLIWTHSFTGNPNFTFFQVFVSYVFYVILASEGIREMLKFRTIQKQEIKEKVE